MLLVKSQSKSFTYPPMETNVRLSRVALCAFRTCTSGRFACGQQAVVNKKEAAYCVTDYVSPAGQGWCSPQAWMPSMYSVGGPAPGHAVLVEVRQVLGRVVQQVCKQLALRAPNS